MVLYSNLKRNARDYHAKGFTLRESVLLAAEHANPYGPIKGESEIPFARHYIPSEFRYQNPNEWRSRDSH